MTPAAKQRAYRERKKSGRIVVRIEIDKVDVSERLIEAGLLDAWDADDPDAIASALASATVTLK